MEKKSDTRNRRSFLSTAATGLVAVSVLAGCSNNQSAGSNGPETVVQTFVRGIHENDIQAIKQTLHSDSPIRKNLDEESIKSLDAKILSTKVVSQEDSSAIVHARLELSSKNSETKKRWITFNFRKEDNSWKIWDTRTGKHEPTTRTETTTETTETETT